MNCPNCGTYNEVEGKFCKNCGVSLTQINDVANNESQLNNQQPEVLGNNTTYSNVQNNAQQLGVGSLTIIRPNNFVGCLLDYEVYVDGYRLGSVSNGQSSVFPLYYGSHLVTIKHGFNAGNQQILINDENRNLVFNCPLKMGLVKSDILFQIVSITR